MENNSITLLEATRLRLAEDLLLASQCTMSNLGEMKQPLTQKATSRDQDGRATKKSARDCEGSSYSGTSDNQKASSATNDNLLAALKQARSQITSGRSGQILVPYNRLGAGVPGRFTS